MIVQRLLAIDPGAKTGWALFIPDDAQPNTVYRLAECGVSSPDVEWYPLGSALPDVVVIENPKIYPHGEAKPDSILKLARVVGRYEERFLRLQIRVEPVFPRDWKGSIDGDVMTARIRAGLSPWDRTVLENRKHDHNTIDAVGLGKWALRQPKIMGCTAQELFGL